MYNVVQTQRFRPNSINPISVRVARNDFLYLETEPAGTPCSLSGDKIRGEGRQHSPPQT
ncbi:hypothetical protein J6590_087598, partial [Homalodisca vitripennis]